MGHNSDSGMQQEDLSWHVSVGMGLYPLPCPHPPAIGADRDHADPQVKAWLFHDLF